MSDPVTPNKGLDLQSTGENPSTWGTVLNNQLTVVDTALGGATTINVTGVSAGNYTLALAQYQPPNIVFTGTISGNLLYLFPGDVGWIGSIYNNTSGAHTLEIGVFSSAVTIPQGSRLMVVCDGLTVALAQTAAAGATPTGLVGLAAVAGSASTFIRSDGAPELDQSIAPTWTNDHTFSAAVALNGGVALQSAMTLSSGAVINATTGGLECATATAGTANQIAASTAFVAASFAPIASPAFTGTSPYPTSTTPPVNDSSTKIATTAFANPAASLSANGHVELPSGIIIQWGRSAGGSSPQSVTFPLAFPNTCWSIVATPSSSATMNWAVSNPASSTTGFSITASDVDPCSWLAIGN